MMMRSDEIPPSTLNPPTTLSRRTRPHVSGVTLPGAVFLCLAVASLAQGSPNLRPYKPQGWSAAIVVSTSPGSTVDRAIDSAPLKPTDILYVNWAVTNDGTTAATSRFYTRFYVDDVLWPTAYYTDPPLAGSYWVFKANISIGALPAGRHTIRLLADSTNAITESDETDNSDTKTIDVGSSVPSRGTARIARIQPSSPESVTRAQSGIFPVSGRVMNGAVAGSTVRFFKVNTDGSKGALLGSAVTDTSGSYLASFSSTPSDSILAESSGGKYHDEVTGAAVALSPSDTLAAIFPARASAVAVTPLSNMAAARARALAAGGELLAAAVTASNAGVGQQYQIPDIIQLLPIAADSASEVQTSTRDQRDYGLVLAGIAQEAHTLGVRAIDLAKALAIDMSDGILDGKVKGSPIAITGTGAKIEGGVSELASAPLTVNAGTSGVQTGIDTFIGGARNRTGLDTFDILNQPVPIGPNGTYVTAAVLPAAKSGKPYGAGPLGVAGGTPPYAWAFAAGSTHPAWLGLTPGGTFGGNAPVLPAGTKASITPIFVVTVSDSSHPVKQLNVPLRITITDPAPELHPFDGECPLNEFCSVVVATADGANSPFAFVQASFAYGTLPLGLHLDASGTVSGTATRAGIYPFGVCVIDVIGSETCDTDPTITVADTVAAPTVSFTVNPGTVAVGESFTLAWATTNATSVSIGGTPEALSGSLVRSILVAGSATYTLTAIGPGGTTVKTATVIVTSGGGGGGITAFDGTYDFAFTINHGGTPETTVLSRYFIVSNGVISTNPAQMNGSVLDGNGNVRFTGPCPVNPTGATYTGTLNSVSPKSGQGIWTCGDGLMNTWQVSNGQ